MATMIVRFHVADFERWKAVFDSMAPARASHGITGWSVHRDADDLESVVTILRARSVSAARGWGASPVLRQATMRAGVDGVPQIQYLEDVE